MLVSNVSACFFTFLKILALDYINNIKEMCINSKINFGRMRRLWLRIRGKAKIKIAFAKEY